MTKEKFLIKIEEYSKYNLGQDKEKVGEVVNLFHEYLNKYPKDTEIWLKLALFYYLSAWHALVSAENCLNIILSYDSHNVYALLLLFYIYEFESAVDGELFQKLCSIQHPDSHMMSMVEYAKSWYFITHSKMDEHEQALVKSIELCDKYVRNCEDLGRLYLQKGKISQGWCLLKKALQNLEYVYKDDDNTYSILDLEDFFKERFQGVRLSSSNYKMLLDSFDPNSFWISGKFEMNPDGTVSMKRGDGTNAREPQEEN